MNRQTTNFVRTKEKEFRMKSKRNMVKRKRQRHEVLFSTIRGAGANDHDHGTLDEQTKVSTIRTQGGRIPS